MTDDEEPAHNIIRFPTHIRETMKIDRSLLREYKLVGHEAVPVTDADDDTRSFLFQRFRTMEETGVDPYHVAFTDLGGGTCISTVFITFDHRYFGDGPPLLFETMLFGHDMLGQLQERCSTWEQAEKQHEAMVALVRASSTG